MSRKSIESYSRQKNDLAYASENEESENDSDFEAFQFTQEQILRVSRLKYKTHTNNQMVPNRREEKEGKSNVVYFEIAEMSGSTHVSQNKLSKKSNGSKLESKKDKFDEDKVNL